MKYRVIRYIENHFDIVVEDGGIASVHHTGDNMTTTYFRTRLTEVDPSKDLFVQLYREQLHVKDWELDVDDDAIIRAALDWLVFPQPRTWEHDNTLFLNLIP
jgi:hypothetical protein